MRDHIVGDVLDVLCAKKDTGLRGPLVSGILAVHAMAWDAVVGSALEERHSRARSTATHGFNDLFTRQLGLAQRQGIATVSAATIAVPLVAAHAIRAFKDGLAWVGGVGV